MDQMSCGRSGLTMGSLLLGLLTGTGIATSLSPAYADGVQVDYISGGVSDESQAEIEALSSNYRLRIVDALEGGAFLADVQQRLIDADGDVVVDVQTTGPITLINAPAGPYTLESRFEGQRQSHEVVVPSRGQKRLDLRWKAQAEVQRPLVPSGMETRIEIP